jgi:hypothetical protein
MDFKACYALKNHQSKGYFQPKHLFSIATIAAQNHKSTLISWSSWSPHLHMQPKTKPPLLLHCDYEVISSPFTCEYTLIL